MTYLFLCVSMIGYRIFPRLYSRIVSRLYLGRNITIPDHTTQAIRCLVVGAGETAATLIKELQKINQQYLILGIVDDNKKKIGRSLHGVPVLGIIEKIPEIVYEYNIKEILLAVPSASVKQLERIMHFCPVTVVKVKIMPHLWDMNAVAAGNTLREIDISDLLGRNEQHLDMTDIKKYVQGKVVLVTGGGGSIGSEMCRQLVFFKPSKLIIFDIYENSAYELQNELNSFFRSQPALFMDCQDMIHIRTGSVQDTMRLHEVFSEYRPHIIFHAAAYKHVPLMEQAPFLAIQNNVFGTYNTAHMASLFQAEKFVMISTDKAVNPTNVMGASKRLAEYIVQSMNFFDQNQTEFVSVRFGNVLGSNGSVIPLFKRQIASGGPITVTHPNITRYFMSIPEASGLVLKAGAFAKGGEIFILNMGNPVKIVDLACKMIELAGYVPNKDILIKFVGLRPGEKLYEELLLDEEGCAKTQNDKILIGSAKIFSEEKIEELLELFRYAVSIENPSERTQKIKKLIHAYVSSYHEEIYC